MVRSDKCIWTKDIFWSEQKDADAQSRSPGQPLSEIFCASSNDVKLSAIPAERFIQEPP